MNRSQRRAASRSGHTSHNRHTSHRTRAIGAVGSAAALASAGAGTALVLSQTAASANPVIEVTTLNSLGPGSLRDAIETANTTSGQDEIRIGVTGTVTLASNLPAIEDGVAIVGPGSGSFTIDGADSFQTLFVDTVTTGTVSITGLTVTGSSIAGVYVGNTTVPVTISDVVATANDSATCGGGFWLYADPTTVTLTDVVAADNYSICDGAGVLAQSYVPGMVVHVSGSRITGNQTRGFGGGVTISGATATISDTEISDNATVTLGNGGGVFTRYYSDLTLDHVTISGNAAGNSGGGVAVASADLTVVASTITGNSAASSGGGLQARDTASLVVTGSTISDNTAYNGGGLYLTNDGGRTVADSTISGNDATAYGGGLVAGLQGPTALLSSTVTANTATYGGDGIVVEGPGGPFSTSASIVAGNGTQDVGTWGSRPVTVQSDHSLLGTFDAADVTVVDAGGTRTGVTAAQLALGPLADNGGPTLTHALLPGSVAIDAGPAAAPDFPGNAWDQRGEGYARVVNGAVDVGAYEVQPPEPEPVPEPTFTG